MIAFQMPFEKAAKKIAGFFPMVEASEFNILSTKSVELQELDNFCFAIDLKASKVDSCR